MKKLPEIASKAWDDRQDAIVFSTVSADGSPNSIYATCVSKRNENSIVVANNFFKKTMENIRSGSTGSILFITKDNKSYQIKGKIDYFTEGEIFDEMKKWNPARLPGHGAAVITFEEVYAGAERLL